MPGRGLATIGNRVFDPETDRALRLVVDSPSKRSIKIETSDGEAFVGARVVPWKVRIGQRSVLMPDEWADRFAATTDELGVAALVEIKGIEAIESLRVTHPIIGSQTRTLDYAYESRHEILALRLGALGRLEGKIERQGDRAAGPISVEVWRRNVFLSGGVITPMRFEEGPIKVADDGSFATPKALEQGATYRLVVRAEGFAPEISPWIKLEEESARVAAIALKPVRSIRGRVVDRQGKPVVNAEVFQSGDGPARTATRTDRDGRFSLGGYAVDRGFIFATKDGFRFKGSAIDARERRGCDDRTDALR